MNEKHTALIKTHVQAIEALLENNSIANDYGVTALTWLEGYINQRKGEATPIQKRWLIEAVGSYFGESLVKAYDGKWVEVRQELSVQMANGRVNAFPLLKVAKFLAAGSTESFVRLFTIVPASIKQALEREPKLTDKKPPFKPRKVKK